MALSDSDVQKQIKHMMAFIDQEANEKVEEIDAKAEEEFNIEKGRLVQQQRVKIMEFYERKEKQIELQKKIQNSNLLNQSRLKVLRSRDDYIKTLVDEARNRLSGMINDKGKYKDTLESLIVQSLLQILEDNVGIRCRKEDYNLVKEVLPSAVRTYEEKTKKTVNIVVDPDNFLNSNVGGGIEMLAQKGRIKVVNTMESRLQMLYQQMLPELREILFGQNQNRKFMD